MSEHMSVQFATIQPRSKYKKLTFITLTFDIYSFIHSFITYYIDCTKNPSKIHVLQIMAEQALAEAVLIFMPGLYSYH